MKESNSRFQIIVMLMKINENNTDEERIIRSAMNFKNKFPGAFPIVLVLFWRLTLFYFVCKNKIISQKTKVPGQND